jgi:hypothetical protein
MGTKSWEPGNTITIIEIMLSQPYNFMALITLIEWLIILEHFHGAYHQVSALTITLNYFSMPK